MTEKQRDKKSVTTRGMLMDESATPAPYSLVTPQELPPAEGDESASQFALLDEREHGDVSKGADRPRRAADEPLTPNETPPK